MILDQLFEDPRSRRLSAEEKLQRAIERERARNPRPGTSHLDRLLAAQRAADAAKRRDLVEFAPDSSGDDGGDDGFSEETLKKFAAQWYNGDEDPQVEKTLMAAGWEIGQDEGYDDEPGVFVVQAGDINGHSFISWPANELRQGVAEGSEQYYAIVHKVNNKPLSTHRNLESAKDEWRGLDQNQRQFYKVVTTKKAPKDWSMKEQGVSEGIDPYRLERLDPQTRRVLIRMGDHKDPGSWLSASEAYAMMLGLQYKNRDPRGWEQEVQHYVDLYRQYSGQGVTEGFGSGLAGGTFGFLAGIPLAATTGIIGWMFGTSETGANVWLGTMALSTALGSWLANKADEADNKINSYRSKKIFSVFVNGKKISTNLMDYTDAGKMIANLAKKEHNPDTYFTIYDNEAEEISWRFQIKDDKREDDGLEESVNQGVSEGSLNEQTTEGIIYATGPRSMGINDVDLVFKNLRTNKIVASVVGNNDHGGIYEIRINQNGVSKGPPNFVARGNPQNSSDEHVVYKLDPTSGKTGSTIRNGFDEENGTYYGMTMEFVGDDDYWSFLENIIGDIMWEDDAIEAGYVDRLNNGDLVFTKQQGVSEGSREHGSAYDRGAADSWYGRPYNPQKYSDAAAQAEYKAGYDENESQASMRKDYDDDRDLDQDRDQLDEDGRTVEVVVSDGTKRYQRRVRVGTNTKNLESSIVKYYQKLGLPVISIDGKKVSAAVAETNDSRVLDRYMSVEVITKGGRRERRQVRLSSTTQDPIRAIMSHYARQGMELYSVDGRRVGAGSLAKNESRMSCPECGGPMFKSRFMAEEQDACYHKVRSRYKVWPSAYASGALVQCRKKGAANWGTGGKKK
jgi:hypothetical protein